MSWDHYKACTLHSAAFTSYDEADTTIRDHTLMTSIKKCPIFASPLLPPFSVCPNGSKLGKPPTPGRRSVGYQPLSPCPPPLVFLQHINYIK